MGIESNGLGIWEPRWKMVFTWQCPAMFLAYSVLGFLSGLTLFVCTPLIRMRPWGAESNVSCFTLCFISVKGKRMTLTSEKIAVVYLAICAIAGSTFVFCSYWIYHYIDVEDHGEEMGEMFPGTAMVTGDLR